MFCFLLNPIVCAYSQDEAVARARVISSEASAAADASLKSDRSISTSISYLASHCTAAMLGTRVTSIYPMNLSVVLIFLLFHCTLLWFQFFLCFHYFAENTRGPCSWAKRDSAAAAHATLSVLRVLYCVFTLSILNLFIVFSYSKFIFSPLLTFNSCAWQGHRWYRSQSPSTPLFSNFIFLNCL